MDGFSDMYIFFADDDPEDQELFTNALRENSETAALKIFVDGVTLMQELQTRRLIPDILFLDLNMPRKSGFECLAEIKRDPALSKMNVIILSTSSHPQNIEYCYKYGASFYAVKPPDFRTLSKLIKKALSQDWEAEIPRSEFLLDMNPSFLRRPNWS